jgi:biopolymer transport protein ExbD
MGAKLSGPGGGSKFSMDSISEINVTPFVDVMLVLLIIFMVAAPLATVSVEVELPNAVAPPAANPPKPVYISIQRGGDVFIGDDPSSIATLADDMKLQVGRRDPSKERIFIRGDKGTRYGSFMEVMNALQDAGFYSVALIGQDANT